MHSMLLIPLSLLSLVMAQKVSIDSKLVGTWTTKSGKVLTGPGFYDPVHEIIHEPELTGISYSFTQDGYYEEAFYRAIANPGDPKCPSAIVQWQHGTFTQFENGSLLLTPFAVDGRQLLSQPCKYESGTLTRYHQTELITKFVQEIDSYNNRQRLVLYALDGTPQNPMWLAYRPPQMLPTSTLNPTAGGARKAKRTAGPGEVESKEEEVNGGDQGGSMTRWLKRNIGLDGWMGETDAEEWEDGNRPWNYGYKKEQPVDTDSLWWLAVGVTGLGGVLFLCF